MPNERDNLYRHALTSIDDFRFDAKVAAVFADMIKRSVPGYSQILTLLPSLTRQSVKTGYYYDLGCSLGAGMIAMAQGLEDKPQEIIGIDSSPAMIAKAQSIIDEISTNYLSSFLLIEEDINQFQMQNAAMILMNFTLQFIPLENRSEIISKCHKALNPGGMLILSEKIQMEDIRTNETLVNIHHQYKKDQGYSELEISQKRDAIENVLIPETLHAHMHRLSEAGFTIVTPWIQNLQFVSILAIK